MKLLIISILSAASIYAVICLFMFFFQKHLVHIPYEQLVKTPLDYGMDYEDLYLNTPDNARLHAWHIPHPKADYTFWIFCGNAGNKSYMLDTVRMIHELGHSVFIYDYRTFGPSKGKLTEQAMYQDTKIGWDYLTQTRGIAPDRIVLHGRSLGTAMATWVATKAEPAAVILESGFTSMKAMAKSLYGWLPIDLILRWQYDNLDRITQISAPILIIHSPDDEIVPYAHGQQLFEAANDEKQFLKLSGSHLDGFMENSKTYTEGITAFLINFKP